MKQKYFSRQSGQVIIGSLLLFLTISITVLIGMATPVAIQVRSASDFLQSKQGYISADVLNEESLYRLNKGKTLPSTLVLSFNDSTSTALISDVGGEKQVIATGVSGLFSRISKSLFTQVQGLAFNYAAQVGIGGLTMSGSPTITGDVTVNGDVTGGGVSTINGSLTSASPSPQTTDQSNGSGVPDVDTVFGNANASQDIAQSFTVSTTTPVVRAMFYMKKTGAPTSAVSVSVVADNAGNPAGATQMSGGINPSQVSGSYGWVPVIFTARNSLVPGTTYWLVIDVPSNSTTNYYTIGTSNTSSYSGAVKLGRYSIFNGFTSAPASNDIFFQLYLGGYTTISGVVVSGTANASVVNSSTVSGTLYCQAGTGNNKSCNTSSSTPATATYPFSDNTIASWKTEASNGGTYTGNLTIGGVTSTTTGPLKINGNLTLTSSGRMTLTGTLYVTGNLTIDGASNLSLSSSYGSRSGVVVVDGTINITASGAISGSGTTGSYVVLATTSTCGGATTCSGTPAISVGGAAGAVVLLVPNGQITFSGSASAKSASAYKMSLSGSTVLTYDSGLSTISFGTSGVSGSWITDTWREISN